MVNDSFFFFILMPMDFNPKMEYPVLFVLHGAGERGNDNQTQLTHGGKLFLDTTIRKKISRNHHLSTMPGQQLLVKR